MAKTVRKLRPSDYWRIGEHESWFADMAAEGLYIKKVGRFFAKFVKGEPNKMKYRIEVTSGQGITSDQMDLYEDNGWEYVTSYHAFHVFSSPAELNAPELHTDPAEQAFTLEVLDNKLTFTTVFMIVMMFLLVGLHLSLWFQGNTPTLTLVEGAAVHQTVLTIFLLYSTFHSLQAAISIRKLRKNLIEGKPIDHHAPWKKLFRFQNSIGVLLTIMLLLFTVIPFLQLIKMQTKTLPASTPDLPIVRLADIDKNPELIRDESTYVSDDVDWGNHYSFHWSPIAPLQYDTQESGIIPEEDYSPYIDTELYQLSIPSLADNLIADLIERNIYDIYETDNFIETHHSELDFLVVFEKDGIKKVIARKGNGIMLVAYYGNADIEAVIESIVEKIPMISD